MEYVAVESGVRILDVVEDGPRAVSSGKRLYAAVVRKLSILPRQPCFSFTAFEIQLTNHITTQVKVNIIKATWCYMFCAAGVRMSLVWFPEPPDGTVPPLTAHGRAQRVCIHVHVEVSRKLSHGAICAQTLLSERGLRLPLQDSSFLTTSETPPTVSLVIPLIGLEHPDSILTETDLQYPSLCSLNEGLSSL
ncbi:hypothetical protein G5714_024375 [Onychostoma macrolepis]|uniref:Uncharacterized protein n=1 Tax=Onychostoma macrolepis TaxID=369639 RepID=A0A7J6BJI9_9TELE|nr:hypothetical protein G5714_024375 [Onychostoma macrolepis]